MIRYAIASSANIEEKYLDFIPSGVSFMYDMNNDGLRMSPWRTPDSTLILWVSDTDGSFRREKIVI
jgi:hypothetical protein